MNQREFRGFQVEVAPGLYGGFAFMGASAYFMLNDSILVALTLYLSLLSMIYFDKPFKFFLSSEKRHLSIVLALISTSFFLPIFLSGLGGGAQFFSKLVIPICAIAIGFYIDAFYREDYLSENGWKKIEK